MLKIKSLYKFSRLISIIGFFVLINSCNGDKDQVPYVHVNFYVSINDPEFSELGTVHNYVYVTGGSRGIIIYRKSFTEFLAMDRNCTYEPSEDCARVAVDSTVTFAECECCDSRFLVSNGGKAFDGPAALPLVNYNTSFNEATQQLQVYN